MDLNCYQVLLVVGMLVTGSINTLSKKAQNDCIVPGYPNISANNTATPHKFDHPWFQTVIMFLGEALCLIGLFISRHKERKKLQVEYAQKLLESQDVVHHPPKLPRVFQIILAIPTCFDLVGTSLAGIGLLYVNASVWQMLRGSIIIFAGLLSKIFLKRKLRCMHWSGIFIVIIGLALVGISSILKDENAAADSKAFLGIAMILAGQAVSASQMIVEEALLKKRGYPPLQVVGLEGTFGIIIMCAIVLPAMYFIPGSQLNGSYENSLDALYQIKNDYKLAIFCLLYLLSIAFYNYFGLAVTKSLTAVHRTLIDACRTIVVWITGLVIYYFFDKSFGEEFDSTYGLLQIDGFLFLMIGTAMYNGLMPMPWFSCCREPTEELMTIQANDGNIQEDTSAENATEKTGLIRGQRKEPIYS
ncbi:unnamed protein product [Owenia fusiformis]|uniref:Uncharacterized protein n=2 Tax=Owenia fusiformis TaxID=6347 RepID=A0A8J1UJG9_OWEFU|nr:unnamed protein product [Owenia fusiformis]